MWLVEVVNANKQLSVSKKFCFKVTGIRHMAPVLNTGPLEGI